MKKISYTNESPLIQDIPIDQLFLDDENPRFAGGPERTSQKEIAKFLWEEMALDELISSIAVNGYYRQEPLLVIKRKSGGFIVVEGNRRLPLPGRPA